MSGWRKVNRALHRDLGYLAVGLTLLYAFTGVWLNHIHDLNPMYALTSGKVEVGPLPEGDDEAVAAAALGRLGVREAPISTFRSSGETLEIFFDGGDKITVDAGAGMAHIEKVQKRGIVAKLNELHLNRARAPWTFIADAYAVILGLLAVTGALLAARKDKVSRRGVALTALGIALAALSLIFAS